jgi:hypothetical protein
MGSDVRPGDIYTIAQIDRCPDHLLKKAVFVYRWLLAPNGEHPRKSMSAQGCRVFAHNVWWAGQPHFLKRIWHGGPPLPLEAVVRPYMSQFHIISEDDIHLSKKENLVLMDNDTAKHVLRAITMYYA